MDEFNGNKGIQTQIFAALWYIVSRYTSWKKMKKKKSEKRKGTKSVKDPKHNPKIE